MQTEVFKLIALYVGAILVLASCAGLQQEVTTGTGGGEKSIAIEADSFKFTPNNIQAYEGDVMVLNINNVSGSTHNITIKDPEGQILQSVDLPAKKAVEVSIKLSKPGEYLFYCDKPMHSLFGMKGRIEVLKR
ncbi:MAG TPA: cupredoxin domain-containing protein [Dissulfurispiraceae bacterium]|nr:cupredoxin domain-containing protein [Dissulfurispiraceae bacterium]